MDRATRMTEKNRKCRIRKRANKQMKKVDPDYADMIEEKTRF